MSCILGTFLYYYEQDEGKVVILVGSGSIVGIVHWDVYVWKLYGLVFLFYLVVNLRVQRSTCSAIADELLVYDDFEAVVVVWRSYLVHALVRSSKVDGLGSVSAVSISELLNWEILSKWVCVESPESMCGELVLNVDKREEVKSEMEMREEGGLRFDRKERERLRGTV